MKRALNRVIKFRFAIVSALFLLLLSYNIYNALKVYKYEPLYLYDGADEKAVAAMHKHEEILSSLDIPYRIKSSKRATGGVDFQELLVRNKDRETVEESIAILYVED